MAFSNLGAPSYLELGMSTQSDACFDLEVIKELASKYHKTPAQIILRWGV
jgi:diketogulonate reductase-like aldo/keto reductase